MSKALSLSKKLHHRYSDQESYLFLYSVLQLSEGEYKKAIKTLLSDDKKMTLRTSSTYYELLGYSHYLGLKQPIQAKDKHNARDYFTKSRIALCSQGLFSPGCSDLLSPVELNQERVGDKNKDIPIKSSHVEGNTWLVNLSSRRFYGIAHREEKSIDALVYMLGPKAKPQDIVFFATNTLLVVLLYL